MITASKHLRRCYSLMGPASSEEMYLFSVVIVWTSPLSSCFVWSGITKAFSWGGNFGQISFEFSLTFWFACNTAEGVINQHRQNKGKEKKVPNVRKCFQHKARHNHSNTCQLKKATVYARVSTHREVLCHTQCVLTEHKLMNEKVNSVKFESWFWHEVPLEETVQCGERAFTVWLLWVA